MIAIHPPKYCVYVGDLNSCRPCDKLSNIYFINNHKCREIGSNSSLFQCDPRFLWRWRQQLKRTGFIRTTLDTKYWKYRVTLSTQGKKFVPCIVVIWKISDLFFEHCKKNWIYVFPEKELRGLVPISTFVCLWAINIFTCSAHLFSCSRIGRPIRGIY
jgi:hypothetical protein